MNRVTKLFKIRYPVIQGGMVWCSGWRLASAVSNNGGLGLLGAGSMYPDVLKEHIQKTKAATNKPFGVNIPLLYPEIDDLMKVIAEEKVEIVFTSAGSPKKWTPYLHDLGITVTHVVSGAFFANKCEDAGVDAIVAEGFEAGGHNGRDETTTMALIPSVRQATKLPLIAAGGIGSGKSMLAAMALGAEGVQIGSLFASSKESSAHENFKKQILEAKEGSTFLSLKKLAPTRLLKNKFFDDVSAAESTCASIEDLRQLLGRGRAKKGMFEGDTIEGELEIGQVSSMITCIDSVENIMKTLISEYREGLNTLNMLQL